MTRRIEMKRVLSAISVALFIAGAAFGQTYDKQVKMDSDTYIFRDRDKIIGSNDIATVGQDISGTPSNSVVVGLRGSAIPAPGGGDIGKGYEWNGATWILGTGGAITNVPWGTISGNITNQTDLWAQLTNRYTKAETDALLDVKVDEMNGVATNLALNGSTEAVDATNATMVVNWRTMTNYVAGLGHLTTNDSPVMAAGTLWAFALATVTNNADSGIEIVNWQTLTNHTFSTFLTTNSSPTMAAGTLWAFALATVTNNADSGIEIVNWQTMTNYVVTTHDLAAVLAAGNNAADDPDYYPANYNNMIAVAATDSADQKAVGWVLAPTFAETRMLAMQAAPLPTHFLTFSKTTPPNIHRSKSSRE